MQQRPVLCRDLLHARCIFLLSHDDAVSWSKRLWLAVRFLPLIAGLPILLLALIAGLTILLLALIAGLTILHLTLIADLAVLLLALIADLAFLVLLGWLCLHDNGLIVRDDDLGFDLRGCDRRGGGLLPGRLGFDRATRSYPCLVRVSSVANL